MRLHVQGLAAPEYGQRDSGCVLVSGGADYIGSHVVALLDALGEHIVVLDDLSTRNREAVLHGELIVGDVGDLRLLACLFAEYRFDAVLHFAACIEVLESVAHPCEYYDCNTACARVLLEACRVAAVPYVVFSATAAVYGDRRGRRLQRECARLLMRRWRIADRRLRLRARIMRAAAAAARSGSLTVPCTGYR